MPEGGPREKLKARMLEIAEQILAREGLDGLQARRIAAQAECSVGTLYNVFRGLDDLIIHANDRTLQRLGQTLVEARDNAPDRSLEGVLLSFARAYLAFAMEHTTPWRALFEHRLSDSQQVPDWYRERQASLFALVEEVLHGTLTDDLVRRRAARALFSAVHGIVAIALDRKLSDFDARETDAQVRLVVAAAARGLAAGIASEP